MNPIILMHETKTSDYTAPMVRVIPITLENAVCGSPLPGGNEDIDYEDWN